MRHGVSSANEYIDLRENRSPSDGPPAFFRRLNGLSRRAHSHFRARPKRMPFPLFFLKLRFESVIGEPGIPCSRINVSAPYPGMRRGDMRDAGNRRAIHERLTLLVFDGFLLVTLHFAHILSYATIARRKVIVIDFNHDDVRGALAARFRDTARWIIGRLWMYPLFDFMLATGGNRKCDAKICCPASLSAVP